MASSLIVILQVSEIKHLMTILKTAFEALFCSPLTPRHERKYVTLLNRFCFYGRSIYFAWFGNAACVLGCEQEIEKPSPAETQDVETSIVTWRNQFRRPKESRFSGFGWISKLATLLDVLDWVTCPPNFSYIESKINQLFLFF